MRQPIRNRQARRQPWRLDPEQVDQPRDAMILFRLQEKIRGRAARPRDLRPDAGIGRLQRVLRQAWPISSDGGIEGGRPPGIDVIIDRVDPFDVRSEFGLSREIEGGMHAEAACGRHRIDEAGEGRAPAQGKVIALGEMQWRALGGRPADNRARERLRAEPGGVYDHTGGDPHGRGAAGFDDKPSLNGATGEDWRSERDRGAMGLRVAPERQHEGVAVDNAGRGRQQRTLHGQRGLESARLLAAEPDEIGDPVGLGLGFKRGELVDLSPVRRHQELAASLVRNAELLAECVQHRFAVDAEPRLVEPWRIIDPGMDDFAVARTNPGANSALLFDDDHLPPSPSERPRHGEPDDTRSDDETFNRLHPSTLCSKWSVSKWSVLRGQYPPPPKRVLAKRLDEEAATATLVQLNPTPSKPRGVEISLGSRGVRTAAARGALRARIDTPGFGRFTSY